MEMKVTYVISKEEAADIKKGLQNLHFDPCGAIDCTCFDGCAGCPLSSMNDQWHKDIAEAKDKVLKAIAKYEER